VEEKEHHFHVFLTTLCVCVCVSAFPQHGEDISLKITVIGGGGMMGMRIGAEMALLGHTVRASVRAHAYVWVGGWVGGVRPSNQRPCYWTSQRGLWGEAALTVYLGGNMGHDRCAFKTEELTL
jgi:hypothetical protein